MSPTPADRFSLVIPNPTYETELSIHIILLQYKMFGRKAGTLSTRLLEEFRIQPVPAHKKYIALVQTVNHMTAEIGGN